jgi:Protein of unknown function (DUF1572)
MSRLKPRPTKNRANPKSALLAFGKAKLENLAMALELTTSFLKDSVEVLRYYKRLGERAMEQAPEAGLFASLDTESNSIAIIVKHMHGNMRSRWTDFLTTDGEKPDRNRDTEFEAAPTTRAELIAQWETGWRHVFEALAGLTESDLSRQVVIRTEAHSVMQAINRALGHYAYHTGQIVYLAKHFAGANWKALTIPRGKSAEINAKMASRQNTQR